MLRRFRNIDIHAFILIEWRLEKWQQDNPLPHPIYHYNTQKKDSDA